VPLSRMAVVGKRGNGGSSWEVIKEVEFLDAAHSPSLSRAFYIPVGTDG
jgi:hypothetical protein